MLGEIEFLSLFCTDLQFAVSFASALPRQDRKCASNRTWDFQRGYERAWKTCPLENQCTVSPKQLSPPRRCGTSLLWVVSPWFRRQSLRLFIWQWAMLAMPSLAIKAEYGRSNSGFERCATVPALVAISGSLIKHWECFPEASFSLLGGSACSQWIKESGTATWNAEYKNKEKQKAQAHILSKNPPEKAANLSMPSS